MAYSRASWLATIVLGAGVAHGAAPQLDQNAPIKLEAGPSDVDYKNNKLAFHKVRITQGGFAIEADDATATGLDFKSSQWVFRGNVKITTPEGSLASDEAHIAFVANAISTAEIIGTPAVFEQKHDKRLTRGRAKHIDYDFAASTVRLTDDAFLSDGDTEISGRTLVYDMRQQRLRANADDQDSQRVRIIITPKKPDAKPNP